jgi:hypothetical protein
VRRKDMFMVKREGAGGVQGVFRVYTDVNDPAILALQ